MFRFAGRSFKLAVVAIMAFIIPALGAPAEVRVSYGPSNDWLGLYVALDQGFFEKHDLHVTPSLIQAPTAVMGALVSGSIDVAGMSSVTFLQAHENGIPIAMVAGAHALPTQMKIGILARSGSNIKSPQDLAGKKIGLAGIGSILYAVCNGWLMDHGVDRTKVNFVEIPWAQQADVMKAGQIDAVLTADPFYDKIKSSGIGYEFGDIYEAAPPGTLLTTYVTLKSWEEQHSDEVQAFRAALQDANDYIAAHPDDARASLVKWAKLPADVVATLPIPNFKVEVGAKQVEWLVELGKRQGMLKGGDDVSSMIAK
jgi:NitT/TauT family transport system substrate-binding protein